MAELYPSVVLACGWLAVLLRRVAKWTSARSADLLEVGFVLLFLAGLALTLNVPASMIVGGVLGVVAVERAASRAQQAADVRHLRRTNRSERAA